MPSDPTSEDQDLEALCAALLAGDERAFERTFRRLRCMIHSVVKADVDAGDIVNETFLVLHRRIRAGTIISSLHRADEAGARPVVIEDWNGLTLWLKQVARYVQRAYWKKHLARRTDQARPTDATTTDEEIYHSRDSLMSIMDYVAEHEPDKLWLLQSRYVLGLSWQEIAKDARAKSAAAAKMAASRLCRTIRQEFQDAV